MEHLESAENMGFRVMRFPNRILYFSSGHAISETHIFFTYLIGDSEIAGPAFIYISLIGDSEIAAPAFIYISLIGDSEIAGPATHCL